jgi:VWFA-related protein
VKEILIAGAMALSMVAQLTGQQQDTSIPSAPVPQTQGIGSVAPGKGATPNSALPVGRNQPTVGSTLPGAPVPDQTDVHPDDGTAPDLPAQGKGAAAFTLPSLRVNFVEIPFTVKDSKGRLVPGLTWRDVRVFENGLRQQPRVFTVDPFPLSVALVIDQSIPFDAMSRVNDALGALQAAFAPYDAVEVFTYNNGPRLRTTFTAGQSPRLAAVVEQSKTTGREPIYYNSGEALSRGIDLNGGAQDHINPLTAGGPGSPQGLSQQQVPRESHTLNDAILAAAVSLSKVAPGRRRIIYVISDGKEYGSKAKTKDVIKYLQTNNISVFATLVGDSAITGLGFLDHVHLPLTLRDNLLPVYTAATGGETYAGYRSRSIEDSFAKITEEVRTQYTVGYYSKEPVLDGKFRSVEVRVLRPNLDVIAKRGYYPTATAYRPAAATTSAPALPPAPPAD